MSDFDPVLWRTASLVRQQLLLRRRTMAELYLPHSAWAHAHKLVRQLQVARTRGWERTVPVLRDRLTWQLEQLHNQLDRVGDELAAQRNTPSLPTVLELVQELRALAAEFEEFQCQPRRGVLRVTTPCIVLNQVNLGPFQIELEIKGLPPVSSTASSPWNRTRPLTIPVSRILMCRTSGFAKAMDTSRFKLL